MKRRVIQIIGLIAAAGCIVAGIMTGEVKTVFAKAVRICLECIGLGLVALMIALGNSVFNAELVQADTQRVVVCDEVSCMQVSVTVAEDITLKKGQTYTLKAELDKSVANRITFKSSKPGRVSVSKAGEIKAIKKGKATVKTTVRCIGGKKKLKFKTVVMVV